MATRVYDNPTHDEKFMRGASDEPGILEQLSRRFQKQTPDFLKLKLEGVIPVFVYGSLRRGFHNHGFLKGLPYLGSAYTTIEKYEMRDAGGGSFPVVFEREPKLKGKKRNPVVGKIRGEVYVVDPKTILALDRLEDNGRMYTRSMQWIFLDEQKIHEKSTIRPSIKCWMYLGEEKFWQGRCSSDPIISDMRNGVRYYDWSDSEEDHHHMAYGYLAQ